MFFLFGGFSSPFCVRPPVFSGNANPGMGWDKILQPEVLMNGADCAVILRTVVSTMMSLLWSLDSFSAHYYKDFAPTALRLALM
jgi:hypothetical protein